MQSRKHETLFRSKTFREPRTHLNIFDESPEYLVSAQKVYKDLPQSASSPKLNSIVKSDNIRIDSLHHIINNCKDSKNNLLYIDSSMRSNIQKQLKTIELAELKSSSVRNEQYFQGVKSIETKVQAKVEQDFPENIKKIKTILSSPSLKSNNVELTQEDLNDSQSKRFISNNKRGFGGLLTVVKSVSPKIEFRKKNTELRFGDERTIMQSIATNVKDMIRQSRVRMVEDREEKQAEEFYRIRDRREKLPLIQIKSMHAEKAKAAANSYFVTNQDLSNRLKRNKS